VAKLVFAEVVDGKTSFATPDIGNSHRAGFIQE
jgi:hypothetical protein